MRNLYQYKKEYNLILEDMALSTFRKNINSFVKSGTLTKKIISSDLDFIESNLDNFNKTVKSIESSDRYKSRIGPVDAFINSDNRYMPQALYNKIKSITVRDNAIKAINNFYETDSSLKDAYASYNIPDTDIVIFIPFTPNANRFLSHKVLTSPGQTIPTWCIAASGAKSMWKRYNLQTQEYPPVFIFCRKSGIGDKYDDNKYEVVFTKLKTSDAVNGKASIFAFEDEIEWRNPEQNEHGSYMGYNNKFKKTFPELAGSKVIDLMTMLMKKYHKEYKSANKNNIIDKETFEDYLESIYGSPTNVKWEESAPKAIEFLKQGGQITIDDLRAISNFGGYSLDSSDFLDLMYIFVGSDAYKNGQEEDSRDNTIILEMPELFKDSEFCKIFFKNIKERDGNDLYIAPEFFIYAINANILTTEKAIQFYLKRVLSNPNFISILDQLGSQSELQDEVGSFFYQIIKKLPAILPILKKEYSPQESRQIFYSLLHSEGDFSEMPELIDTACEIYYRWVTSAEPFVLDAFGNIYSTNYTDYAAEKIYGTIIRVFNDKPEFLSVNIRSIKNNSSRIPVYYHEKIIKLYNNNGQKEENYIEKFINQLIDKFKDNSITLTDFKSLNKLPNIDIGGEVFIPILSYLNNSTFNFSKSKLDPEEFFIQLLNYSYDNYDNVRDKKLDKEFWTFFNNNYQDLKYIPFYHGIDNSTKQTEICQHILETFIKYNKVDKEWVNFYFNNWHQIMPRCREGLRQLQFSDNGHLMMQKLAKLVRPYIPDDIFKDVFRGYYD